MAEQALVLSADKWEMVDERTGEVNRGVTVFFVNEYREDSTSSIGFKPSKISASPQVFDDLKGHVPGYFELNFGSRSGAQGKATLTLTGVNPVSPVELFALHSEPA